MAVTATYTVEIAWSGAQVGLFVFGFSTIGGTDVLGGGFGYFAYDNVTSDVMAVTIRRGRRDLFQAPSAGEATLNLTDADGKYDARNTASPLYGKLVPLRPVRIRATYGGVTYDLYSGYVRRISADLVRKTATIQCIDLFSWLARAKPVIAATGATTTGAAIGKVLDAIGFTQPAYRSLQTGDTLPDFSAAGDKTGLELINGLLVTAAGQFFISAGGVATYLDRYAANRAPRATAQSSVTNVITDAMPDVDLDTVYNRATVLRTGGVSQTYSDTPSVQQYGYSDLPKVESGYLKSDNQAASLARWLVIQRKSPQPNSRQLQLANINDATLTAQLARDIGDHIAINQTTLTGDYNVVGIEHAIASAGLAHKTVWTLEQRSSAALPIVIGTSTIGNNNVFVY